MVNMSCSVQIRNGSHLHGIDIINSIMAQSYVNSSSLRLGTSGRTEGHHIGPLDDVLIGLDEQERANPLKVW